MGHATPQEPCTAPDQTKPQTGTPERVNIEEPGSSQQVGVQDTLGAGLEVRSVDQSEASQHLGEPIGYRVNTEASTPETDLHPDSSDRDRSYTEASTSELRPNESEAAPNTETAPSVGPSTSSRVSVGFEVLGQRPSWSSNGGHKKSNPRRVPGKCRGFLPRENCSRHSYFPLPGKFLKTNFCFNQFLALHSKFAYLPLYSFW